MKGYFDHNATTPVHPAAIAAWTEAARRHWHNPSSLYREAAGVKHRLDEARERLADLLECEPGRVVFTSGATEANNGLVRAAAGTWAREGVVVSSSVEHPSLAEPLGHAFRGRWERLPVQPGTLPDLTVLEKLLADGDVTLVTMMAANNESGTLHPWQEAARLCRKHEVRFHCDASQWIGKMPLAGLAACDYVTGSAHKFGGPKGTGFLLVKDEDDPLTLALGGPQEEGRRAGTEDYPAIAAMVAALEAVEQIRAAAATRQAGWRDALVERVSSSIPGTRLVGADAPRLWNTAMLVMPEHDHRKWLARLSQSGFAVSTGSACSAGDKGASAVMRALATPPEEWRRVLRISGGWETTEADWRELATAMEEASQALGGATRA